VIIQPNMAPNDSLSGGGQILFMKNDGSVTPEPFDPIIPILRVSIKPVSLEDEFNAMASADHIVVDALVDTGADGVFIDEDFAEKHGFVASGMTEVSSAGHTGMHKIYPAHFQLVDDAAAHFTQTARFISNPLRKNGRKYDLVLGTLFLCNGTLIMDFPNKIFRFRFTTQPKK